MMRISVTGNPLIGEISCCICFVVSSRLTFNDLAYINKRDSPAGKVDVYARQSSDLYLDLCLLFDLAHNCLAWQLVSLYLPSWEIPEIDITPMAKQNPLPLIKDDSKCSYFEVASDTCNDSK